MHIDGEPVGVPARPSVARSASTRRAGTARRWATTEPCKKILYVEDDRETAASIAEELVERGFEVEIAHDGLEGLAKILREAPDLVLSEIDMPVMSGLDLLERLRAVSPRSASIPFVFLTTPADRDNRLRVGQRVAHECVVKPVDVDLLVTTIRAGLRRAAHAELWLRQVDLSDREVETLTWAARGKTSAEIAMIVGLTKRTVDFHIDNARAKLGVATRIEAAVRAATGRLIEV